MFKRVICLLGVLTLFTQFSITSAQKDGTSHGEAL